MGELAHARLEHLSHGSLQRTACASASVTASSGEATLEVWEWESVTQLSIASVNAPPPPHLLTAITVLTILSKLTILLRTLFLSARGAPRIRLILLDNLKNVFVIVLSEMPIDACHIAPAASVCVLLYQ